jgi:hypothetical protein
MGLLDDLAMGLGLKDRDDDYYERTARTIGRTQGDAREAQYRRSSGFGESGRQGLLSGGGMGGYRDINDMFDGGGPMARGGRFEGGGLISFLANLLNAAAGRDMGEKVGYGAPMEATMKPKARMMPTPSSQQDFPNYAPSPSGVMPPMSQNMMESGARPIRPMPEALPANLAMPISSSKPFLETSQEFGPSVQQPEGMMMSRQQFETFIIPKYKAEYGKAPSQQQIDMGYNRYMSNMGIANNSTNDDNTPPVNQGSALSLEDLRALKTERRRLGVTDPNVLTSIAAENPFNPMAQYSTAKFGNVDLMQIAAMLQRGANRDGLIANFGADAVREAESMLSDPFYRSIGQLPLGMGGQFGTINKRELRQRPIKSYRDPSQSTYNTGLLQ